MTLPESWTVGREVKFSLSSFNFYQQIRGTLLFQKTRMRTLRHMGPIQFRPSSSSTFQASSQVWKSRPRMMTFLRGLAETKAAGTIHQSIKEQKSFTSPVKSLTGTSWHGYIIRWLLRGGKKRFLKLPALHYQTPSRLILHLGGFIKFSFCCQSSLWGSSLRKIPGWADSSDRQKKKVKKWIRTKNRKHYDSHCLTFVKAHFKVQDLKTLLVACSCQMCSEM